MKVDKELLIKHHFWILLATYAPLVLLSLILLWTSVAGAIDKKAKEIETLKGSVKAVNQKDVKNKPWIDGFHAMAEELAAQKNKIWGEVWNSQASMFNWPESLRSTYPNLNDLDYGEDLSPVAMRDSYINDPTCYRKQLEDMVAIVRPVNSKGEGVVQFRGGAMNVIHHVGKWLSGERQTVPSSQEIWLAQEDYWVQRELLQVIRDANDVVAVFEKVDKAAPPKQGEISGTFENPVWRLHVAIKKDRLHWRITNLSPRQQMLALTFRLKFDDRRSRDQELWVDGEPMAPNQSRESGPEGLPFKGFLTLKEIQAVEQVLDWRTAPVKRIDMMMLGVNSHSTAAAGLVAFRGFADKEKADDPAAAPGPGKVLPGEVPGSGPKGPGRRGSASELGLEKFRYLDSNEQVRRMPVALMLIVDQTNTQDVLTAFARSRLRFQVTQVEWKRYRGSIQPAVIDDGAKPEGPEKPPVPGGPASPGRQRGGRKRPASPPGAIGAADPAKKPAPGKPVIDATDVNDEDSSNLVEMMIYGIASLYHRYPPKAQAEAPAGSTPAAPAPAGPPAGRPGKEPGRRDH